jgi:organic radical activating enzyme
MNKSDYKEGQLLPLVEEFYTLQGEGYHTGVAAYFIRLGGCDVGCRWCDAKYTWNAKTHPLTDTDSIVERAAQHPAKSIVITGGEPLLYPLDYLTERLHNKGLRIFLETSGSHPWSGTFDWVCLSPKKQAAPLAEAFDKADELKVIIEKPEDLKWAEECATKVRKECRLYLQPEWSQFSNIIECIVNYAMENPKWKVSIQTHKYMHIP